MSGGYGHSLMDAMRQALSVSICISFNKEGYKPMDFKNVFYLATLGGAQGKIQTMFNQTINWKSMIFSIGIRSKNWKF